MKQQRKVCPECKAYFWIDSTDWRERSRKYDKRSCKTRAWRHRRIEAQKQEALASSGQVPR